MRRIILAALALAAGGAGCFNAAAHAATSYSGSMAGPPFKFAGGNCQGAANSGDFCINVGDTVTWTNNTTSNHTVTGDSFGNKTTVAPGNHVSYTFDTIGTFPYHCDIHNYMTGSVTVSEPATTTSRPTTTTTIAATTTTKQTTTSTTAARVTTTTSNVNGVFDNSNTSLTEPTTTLFTTDTTRALGQGGGGGTSAGVIAAIVVAMGAVGTAAALVIRRMRAGGPPI